MRVPEDLQERRRDWSHEQIHKIVADACNENMRQHRPIIVWARRRVEVEKQRAERLEKIKMTLLGQVVIWATGASLFFLGNAVLNSLGKALDSVK